jgi:hypothetical protein
MPNKILFLDFDGVLNPDLYHNHMTKMWRYKPDLVKSRDQFGDYFAPWCVDELRALVNLTGCDIVISSTWRAFCDVKHLWEYRGMPGTCIGRTPIGHESRESVIRNSMVNVDPTLYQIKRGEEVQLYIDMFGKPDKMAIIDDIDEFTGTPVEKYFVQTNEKYGWTRKETERLIELLY